MILVTNTVTYMRSGTIWDPYHLENMYEQYRYLNGSQIEIFINGNTIEDIMHSKNLLEKRGYYDSTDLEFIKRLESFQQN